MEMSNKKQQIPAIRFNGFTDAWEQRKLMETNTSFTDGNYGESYPSGNDMSDSRNGVPFLRGSNLKNGKLDNSGANYITLEKHKELTSGHLVYDDIVIAVRGSLGALGYVDIDNVDWNINSQLAIIRTDKSELNGAFVIQFLSSNKGQKELLSRQTGTALKQLPIKQLQDVPVPKPELAEQNKISEFFRQLDDTIALHQRELDNLKITKQVFMKKMFPKEGEKVPEVRFPGFMADWDYRKLGDVGETYTGLSGKSKDDFGHGRGKYVTYMNVFSNSIANPSLVELVEIDTKQNEVNPGDIFFTTSSETPAEVGMSSVWLENSDNTYLNSFCFGYRPIEKFDNYYLAYMLRSSVVRKKITFLAQGISRYNISKNKVMDIAVPIPVIEEQTKIGEFFKQLDDIINLQQQELEKLKQTKQAFLQKMFI